MIMNQEQFPTYKPLFPVQRIPTTYFTNSLKDARTNPLRHFKVDMTLGI